MIDPIKMNPCPFCEGPPCITARNWITKEELGEGHKQNEDCDEAYEAHVWCHDCGAQGPNINTCTLGTFEQIYDLEVADVMRIAIERWNDRHNRARDCYDAGEKKGLNIWPRAEA